MSLDGKIYADKAVQTTQVNALGFDSGDTIQHSAAFRFDDRTIVLDAAFTSPNRCPISPQLGPSRSPQASRRIYKHPQLPYSRPSHANSLEKRVVSLPDAMPIKGSSSLTVPAVSGPSLRVVSLPSIATHSLSRSPFVTEDNFSLECLDTSADTSSYRSSRAGSVHMTIRNFPPSDMPTTPSPPSSPESLLIIGNDPCIPRSFLRRNKPSPSSAFCNEDEAVHQGWITWASSPPRPIPALHGPLSLPYARCPSGAEGTIIEDADLPRMIWGLELDGPNSNTPRNFPSISIVKTQPHPDPSRTKLSAETAFRGQSTGTLPNHLYPSRTSDRNVKETTTLDLKSPPANYVDTRTFSTAPHTAWNDAPIQLHGPPIYYDKGYHTARAGDVGGIWHDVLASSTHNGRPQTSDLKPSATPFIPNMLPNQPVSGTHPRIFVEPRAGSQITPERRLSAIEIAQRYHIEQQQQSALPTPPSSSSPLWSPTLTTSYVPSTLPHTSGFCDTQETFPEQYYASELSGRDFSEELRQIEAAKRKLSNIIGLPGVALSESESNHSSRMKNPLIRQDFLRQSSPVIDVSLILKQRSTVSRLDSNPPNLFMPQPNVTSALQLRNPLGQPPQSIPMARLIQRRLSSVKEEDANHSLKSDSPSPNSRYTKPEEKVRNSESAGMTYDGHHNGRTSRPDGNMTTGGANLQDGRGNGTKEDNGEKENTASSAKGTNVAKPTPRKKWRPRKKTAVSSAPDSRSFVDGQAG